MVFWTGRAPCAACGAVVDRAEADEHACDPDRRVEFQMTALRRRVATFQADLWSFLSSSEGRFETWQAARQVRRDA